METPWTEEEEVVEELEGLEGPEEPKCPDPAFPHFILDEGSCLNCQVPLLDANGDPLPVPGRTAIFAFFPNGNDFPAAYDENFEACCPHISSPTQIMPNWDPVSKMCVLACPNSDSMYDFAEFIAGNYGSVGSQVCCPPSEPNYNTATMTCEA